MKQALGAGIGWKAGRKMSLWGPRPCVSLSIPQATVQMPQRSHRSLHRCPTGASVGVKSTVRTAVGRRCTKARGREYESGLKRNGPFPFKKNMYLCIYLFGCAQFSLWHVEQNLVPCIGSMDSQLLDNQGSAAGPFLTMEEKCLAPFQICAKVPSKTNSHISGRHEHLAKRQWASGGPDP